jgi:hypothetical protein
MKGTNMIIKAKHIFFTYEEALAAFESAKTNSDYTYWFEDKDRQDYYSDKGVTEFDMWINAFASEETAQVLLGDKWTAINCL